MPTSTTQLVFAAVGVMQRVDRWRGRQANGRIGTVMTTVQQFHDMVAAEPSGRDQCSRRPIEES